MEDFLSTTERYREQYNVQMEDVYQPLQGIGALYSVRMEGLLSTTERYWEQYNVHIEGVLSTFEGQRGQYNVQMEGQPLKGKGASTMS